VILLYNLQNHLHRPRCTPVLVAAASPGLQVMLQQREALFSPWSGSSNNEEETKHQTN